MGAGTSTVSGYLIQMRYGLSQQLANLAVSPAVGDLTACGIPWPVRLIEITSSHLVRLLQL